MRRILIGLSTCVPFSCPFSTSGNAGRETSKEAATKKEEYHVGEIDLRHRGIGGSNDDWAPLCTGRALLAVVFPVSRGHGRSSLLRIQQLGAMHGNNTRHRRLLLQQSVPSAPVRAIRQAAPPCGA